VVGPYVTATIHATVDGPTVTEGTGAGSTLLTFTIKSNGNGAAITVNYSTASGATNPAVGGSSCSQGVDFINTGGSVTFTANNQTQLVDVTVCRDSLDEADETVNLNLTGDDIASGTGTVTDDDATPSLTINDVSQNEGNSGTTAFAHGLVVGSQRTNRHGQPCNGERTMNPATGGSVRKRLRRWAFPHTSPTTTSSAGDTSKTVSILVCGDTTIEPNETFLREPQPRRTRRSPTAKDWARSSTTMSQTQRRWRQARRFRRMKTTRLESHCPPPMLSSVS
jgi:hypothetical protein